MAGRKPTTDHGRMVKLTIAFPAYVLDALGRDARPQIREIVTDAVDARLQRGTPVEHDLGTPPDAA